MTRNYYEWYFYQLYKFIKTNYQYYILEVLEKFSINNTFYSLNRIKSCDNIKIFTPVINKIVFKIFE